MSHQKPYAGMTPEDRARMLHSNIVRDIAAPPALAIPTVHLNGDTLQELVGQNWEARNAIESAIEKVQAAGPNGRNFYPQGPDALREAIRQHTDRLSRLETLKSEFETIVTALTDRV